MTVEYLGVVLGIFLNETMLSAILINKPVLESESVPREKEREGSERKSQSNPQGAQREPWGRPAKDCLTSTEPWHTTCIQNTFRLINRLLSIPVVWILNSSRITPGTQLFSTHARAGATPLITHLEPRQIGRALSEDYRDTTERHYSKSNIEHHDLTDN
jgi:hypothetical protein